MKQRRAALAQAAAVQQARTAAADISTRPSQRPHEGRFYVPQLDGLRFVAFLLVFAHHENPALMMFPFQAVRTFMTRANTFGWMGVDVFFCLSSFLITSLLLREQSATGDVSLRRFYIRRALRIWPLYYFALLLIFLVFPMFGYLCPATGTEAYRLLVRQHLFPFSIFLGNFSYATFTGSLAIPLAPLWSISVEEQFYLVWPLLISSLGVRRLRAFGCVLAGLLTVTILTRVYITVNAIPYPMIWVNTLARLDPFILGTAVAIFHHRNQRRIHAVWAFVVAILLLIAITSFPQIGASAHTIWQLFGVAAFSAALLVSVLYGRFGRFLLGNAPMRWAGKLSYGFYVFHRVGLAVADRYYAVTAQSGTAAFAVQSLFSMLIALAATIAISAASYYALERWFLILKDRYAVIHSRTV